MISNQIIAAIIIAIVGGGGILYVGQDQGWFGKADNIDMSLILEGETGDIVIPLNAKTTLTEQRIYVNKEGQQYTIISDKMAVQTVLTNPTDIDATDITIQVSVASIVYKTWTGQTIPAGRTVTYKTDKFAEAQLTMYLENPSEHQDLTFSYPILVSVFNGPNGNLKHKVDTVALMVIIMVPEEATRSGQAEIMVDSITTIAGTDQAMETSTTTTDTSSSTQESCPVRSEADTFIAVTNRFETLGFSQTELNLALDWWDPLTDSDYGVGGYTITTESLLRVLDGWMPLCP